MRFLVATLLIIGALVGLPASAGATTPAGHTLATGLPDARLTPGAMNPAVTQATIRKTICVQGWSDTIRPSSSYTNDLKQRQIGSYGFADKKLGDYEEDHLIPLDLGGSPKDPRNLWPEPHHVRVGGRDLGSYVKDGLERILHSRVCSGKQALSSAQREIALNWVKYWQQWRPA